MDEDALTRLKRLLAEHLKGVRLTAPETTEAGYDPIFKRVIRRLPAMRDTVERNQARVADRYADLVEQPLGRQKTVLANSPPTMLLALAHGLMQESFAERFDDPRRSLALASLAHRAAKAVAETDYLSRALVADLIGESLCHLGNAMRINSDLTGAERAFAEAEIQLAEGTRDRTLLAKRLSFLASLRQTQGRAQDAADLLEREARIWRLLNDPHKLGFALIGSGLAWCWLGETRRAAGLILEGIRLVEDDRLVFLGLVNLAEALARDGKDFEAWRLLCTGEIIGMMTEVGENLTRRHRWVQAIAYRSHGELLQAERLLTSVRDELIENGESLRAALASLDLLAVLAAQGKHRDVISVADAAHRILFSEGLEQKALSAFMLLHQAALAEQLTEDLAVRVANFIMRHRHDKEARFE